MLQKEKFNCSISFLRLELLKKKKNPHREYVFIDFERVREKETLMREKNNASHTRPDRGTDPHLSVYGKMLHPTEPPSQGSRALYLRLWRRKEGFRGEKCKCPLMLKYILSSIFSYQAIPEKNNTEKD